MKVAVLGFGTVGAGIYEMLANAKGLEQGPVLVRPGKDDAPFKRTSIEAILAEPGVEAVAEAMGGIEPAFSYAMAALKAGKHFVTFLHIESWYDACEVIWNYCKALRRRCGNRSVGNCSGKAQVYTFF